jgi:uncharacterized protein (DUF362 family)
MNRREFIKTALAAAVPVFPAEYDFLKDYADYTIIRPVKNRKFARVVSCRDEAVVSGDFTINNELAARLLKTAILEFTGKNSIREAVRGLFPKFRDDLRVSLKINTASWDMPTHRVVAETMAACLVEAGLRPDNIIIWERTEDTLKGAGYAVRTAAGSVKTVATDTAGYGYDESRSYRVGGIPVYLTSIITEKSDYMINLGVLKHHFMTGVTTAMKNLYGTIPLLDRPFLMGLHNVLRFHLNACDPCVAELNALVAEKVPTILYICDGLLGMYNDGPWGPPQWAQNEIILSNDPVALDTIALFRIEHRRKDVGLPPVMNRALFIRTAAHLGLGTNDPGHMDMIQKVVR